MALDSSMKESIERTIENSLREKFATHNPEPAYMPFHTRLLGKDRLALYSFIHSLNTRFGTAIFEPVAKELSVGRFKEAHNQVELPIQISSQVQGEIQAIMNELSIASRDPESEKEVERIRKICRGGTTEEIKLTRVDLYLLDNNNKSYLIDLKTAKPNKSGFKDMKRQLLEWAAVSLYEDPAKDLNCLIAIPYNPYHPKPYERWTAKGMLDFGSELKVGEEFWDFVGGEGAYEDLLDCFERVGCNMRDEIDAHFANF